MYFREPLNLKDGHRKWGQGPEREKVRDQNLTEVTETGKRNNIKEERAKEKKRFLNLNKVPIFKLDGPNVHQGCICSWLIKCLVFLSMIY